MSQRYFVETPITTDHATLSENEARHLIKVMRQTVGCVVVLFDDSGAEFDAEVVDIGRSEVRLKVLERREVDRESPVRLTLAVALPKGDRQRWLVEKLVELGTHRLVPLKTQRGVAQPVANALVRLRRAVIEASKQCGRNRLMEICPAVSLTELFGANDENADDSACYCFADPGGVPLREMAGAENTDQFVVAIGPEGGWTDAERTLAQQAGWTRLGLGPRTMRIETAAVAVAAALAR